MSDTDPHSLRRRLDSELHLYFCDPSSFSSGDELQRLRSVLSAEELARLDAFRFDRDRYPYLVSHAMLRHALSNYAELSPAQWHFTANHHGRPAIVEGQPALQFNLAHTQGLCVALVTKTGRCGIDVEYLHRDNDMAGIAARMFTAAECDYMHADAARMRERFFLLWTCREAYLKAIGTGLSGNSKGFGFEVDDSAPAARIVYSEGPDRAESWHLRLARPTPHHVMAVCVESDEPVELVSKNFGEMLRP